VAIHGFVCLDKDYWPAHDGYIRLWDLGVAWSNINPSEGRYDFSRLEEILSSHPGRNFSMTLAGTPQWAATNPAETGAAAWVGPASNSPPARMTDWDNFVYRTVLACAGRVSSFQIWNEPQLVDFWKPYTAIDKLGQMTLRARSIIKHYAPRASVVSAPCLPRASSGGMTRASKYLQTLKYYGWPVDVHTAHIYPEIGKATAAWRDYALAWKAELKRLSAPNCPLWITETNYNLLGGALTDAQIRQRIPATDTIADELGIRRVYWYAYGVHSNPAVLGIPFQATGQGTTTLAGFQ
jgi:hypothetical protein